MASKVEINRTISRTLVKYVTLKWSDDGMPETVNREISFDGILQKEKHKKKSQKWIVPPVYSPLQRLMTYTVGILTILCR